ncbi:hypothetical protein BaRGS_00022467 [Batillaria attramentaria]|uniref:Uncharacterized protein n=1 Tax=Batillaria attramentaria TaxID=370345 RepID=A0ABD0KGS2_9CAEN
MAHVQTGPEENNGMTVQESTKHSYLPPCRTSQQHLQSRPICKLESKRASHTIYPSIVAAVLDPFLTLTSTCKVLDGFALTSLRVLANKTRFVQICQKRREHVTTSGLTPTV